MSARTRFSDQEGAVAVTVGVSLIALIGVSMLAVDGGALWSSRRNIVTDTDAAALAGARVLLHGDCTVSDILDAQVAAADVLGLNDSGTVLSGPAEVLCQPDSGRVMVSAFRPTDLAFGGLAGVPEVDVASTSIAQVGQVVAGEGLRPIAICNKDPHFLEFSRAGGHIDDQGIIDLLGGQAGQELLDLVDAVAIDNSEHPTSGPEGPYPPGNEVHRVWFSRAAVNDGCGQSGGNWGWLDFDGGGGGAQQVRDWLRNGYGHPITVGDDENCAPEVTNETDCVGEPGAGGNSWSSALDDIHCPSNLDEVTCIGEGLAFPVIVFDALRCVGNNPNNCGGGNGANARYDPDAFLGVILRNWSPITGNPNNQSYFDLQFVDPFITNGTIAGANPGSGPGMVAIQLCGGGIGAAIDDFCVVP